MKNFHHFTIIWALENFGRTSRSDEARIIPVQFGEVGIRLVFVGKIDDSLGFGCPTGHFSQCKFKAVRDIDTDPVKFPDTGFLMGSTFNSNAFLTITIPVHASTSASTKTLLKRVG